MNKLSERCAQYTLPQEGMSQCIYPYHRCISSKQDTEVIMEGRKVLMFGSNSYLGLTNHPKVIEAAVEAAKKYGTGCAGSRYLNGTIQDQQRGGNAALLGLSGNMHCPEL